MWTFKEIRALAIDNLDQSTMGPVEQVLAAKQYNVPKWLRSGYIALVERHETLSVTEAGQLGYLTAILLFQIREQVRERGGGKHSLSNNIRDGSGIIARIFEQELRAMENVYEEYQGIQ
jgi:hypothetical protein